MGPLLGFALGSCFACLTQAEAEREDDEGFRSRTRAVSLFALFVFAPVCAYFLIFAGDWAYAYLVDSALVPSALTLVLVVVDGALVPLGFIAAHRVARPRAMHAAMALAYVPLGLATASTLWVVRRLSVEGTFRQVTGHFGTRPIGEGPLGYALVWMLGMLAVGVVVTLRAISVSAPLPKSGSTEGESGRDPQGHLESREGTAKRRFLGQRREWGRP